MFSAFDKVLVLAGAFFYSRSNEKNWKNMFSAFDKVLVLAGAFFLFKI